MWIFQFIFLKIDLQFHTIVVRKDACYHFNIPKMTRHVLWPIAEDVPRALEKNVYSAACGWSALSIKSLWTKVSFKSNTSLFHFCLDDPSIDQRPLLWSCYFSPLLSPFISVYCLALLFLPLLLLIFTLYI